MKMAPILVLAALPALLISSCTAVSKTAIATQQPLSSDYDYITPRPSLELGMLYRSAKPLSARGLPELKPLCEADFKETVALSELQAKYASAPETRALDDIAKETGSANLAVSGVRFSWLTLGAHTSPESTTSVEFTGVTVKEMAEEDAALVWQNLGENCRALVRDRLKQGFGVYVPTEAYKAASVNITTEVRQGGGIDVGVKLAGPPHATGEIKNTSTRTFRGEDMYYKLRTSTVPTQ